SQMHAPKPIAAWLHRQVQAHSFASLLGAAGLFALSLVVLAFTLWVIYATIWMGFNWLVPHSHAARLCASFAVLAILFVSNAMIGRHDLETVEVTTGSGRERPVVVYVPFVGVGSTVNPLAPDAAPSAVEVARRVLLIGPRLVALSFRMLGRARRLSTGDLDAGAAVLGVLAAEDGRVRLEKVLAAMPKECDVVRVFKLLQEINAVMLLKS